jgi:hypothetical protein
MFLLLSEIGEQASPLTVHQQLGPQPPSQAVIKPVREFIQVKMIEVEMFVAGRAGRGLPGLGRTNRVHAGGRLPGGGGGRGRGRVGGGRSGRGRFQCPASGRDVRRGVPRRGQGVMQVPAELTRLLFAEMESPLPYVQ